MNEELKILLEEIWEKVSDTLPHTIMGYLLVVLVSGVWLRTNSIEFLASVGTTGIYIACLTSGYYVSRALLILVNEVTSRFTSEKRVEGVN